MTETKKYRNDWEKVVRSLIGFLRKDGFDCYKASDGEEEIESNSAAKLAGTVCACDEGWLSVRKGETHFRCWIVLGNSPSELVADYSYKRATDCGEFDAVLYKFSDYWIRQGDACPKKEAK